MYQLDFKKPIHVYFIGIGGISMSGLAEILLSEGFRISGSDSQKSALTEELAEKGAHIFYGQRKENLTEDVDLVVYTSAIHPDNPEFIRMKELGLSSLNRADLLGQMMKNYPIPIAISGTHGKTTTTSMISEILLQADKDPTLSIGGVLKDIGDNYRVGNSPYFVTEACEYTNSFLSFFPKIGVIMNIEEDHLDFFKDLADIRHSFHEFAKLLPADGTLILPQSLPDLSDFTKNLPCQILTFGDTPEASYYYDELQYDEMARPSFVCHGPDEFTIRLKLAVPGRHNVDNALASIAVCHRLGIDTPPLIHALEHFTGTERRFEYKGTIGGVTVIDDYAHHPTEIRATLSAARNYPHKTCWCIFQPHTYTRTKSFLHEFAEALSLADRVVLADIYAARETDTLGISSGTLQKELASIGKESFYFRSFDEIENFLLENCTSGDLLITMGAGDVHIIGENLLGL